MLRRVQSGLNSFYFMDGIHQFARIKKVSNGEDEYDFYYHKELINATLLNGTEIHD